MAADTTDEELAAGWEASVASGQPGGGDDVWNAETGSHDPGSEAAPSIAQQAVGSERILNPDEIDSLRRRRGAGAGLRRAPPAPRRTAPSAAASAR